MSLKQFIVPLGVSLLTFAIVGIYFHCRQRLNALENKMNVLFQLIQQHTTGSQNGQEIKEERNGASLIAVSDDDKSDSENSDESEFDTSDEEDDSDEETDTRNIRSIDISNTLPVISLDNVTATLSVSKLESSSSKSSLSDLGSNGELPDTPIQTPSVSEEVKAELSDVDYVKFTVPKLKELVDKFGLVKSSGKLKRAQLINILDAAKI